MSIRSNLLLEFEIVREHVLLLAIEWRFYNDLYSTQESVDLLNQSASYFFSKLQIIFIDSIILKIAKLLENKETGKGGSNKNLTIDYLLNNIDTYTEYKNRNKFLIKGFDLDKNKFFISKYKNIPSIYKPNSICGLIKIQSWSIKKQTLNNRFELLKSEFTKLNNYRNKNLAHIDMPTQISSINHLPKDTFDIISNVLNQIYLIMNEIEVYLKDSNTAYETIIMSNGVSSLHYDIKKSLRYEELLTNGDIDKYDFIKNSESIDFN